MRHNAPIRKDTIDLYTGARVAKDRLIILAGKSPKTFLLLTVYLELPGFHLRHLLHEWIKSIYKQLQASWEPWKNASAAITFYQFRMRHNPKQPARCSFGAQKGGAELQ
jgi:hypothetical protein